jgi:hypothetical protein
VTKNNTREALEHFLDLAATGAHPTSSTTEGQAYELARAVVDQVPGLDPTAVKGLCEFAELASRYPQRARQCIEGIIQEGRL